MEAKETTPAADAETRSKIARGVGQAAAGAHETIDTLSDAARPAVDRLASGAHVTVDRVASAATQAAETLGAKGATIKTAQDQLVESAREYVRQNPVAALGIAVATGFVLSRLLSSK